MVRPAFQLSRLYALPPEDMDVTLIAGLALIGTALMVLVTLIYFTLVVIRHGAQVPEGMVRISWTCVCPPH